MIINWIFASNENGVITPDNLFGPALIRKSSEGFDEGVLSRKVLFYRSVIGIERELEIIVISKGIDFRELLEEP